MPHDIVETRDGSVFVGDAGRSSVFKFTSESKFSSIHPSMGYVVLPAGSGSPPRGGVSRRTLTRCPNHLKCPVWT